MKPYEYVTDALLTQVQETGRGIIFLRPAGHSTVPIVTDAFVVADVIKAVEHTLDVRLVWKRDGLVLHLAAVSSPLISTKE